MFEFAYPWVLLALALTPLLYWYLAYRKRLPSVTLPNVAPMRGAARLRPHWSAFAATLVLALLILALARPRFGDEEVEIRSEGIDIMLAIDLSGSMEAIDIPAGVTTGPQLQQALKDGDAGTRIEVAKRELRRFVDGRPDDRIGLIGFGELAFSLAPPTLDHSFLDEALRQLSTDWLGRSTNIAAPVATGIKRLADSDAPRRVLVLFTDGRNNIEDKLSPIQAAELAKSKDVIIYTVGIGNPNAVIMTEDLFGGKSLQPFQGEFDEALLKQMATISGGRYFHAGDAKELEQVLNEINQLEKITFEQPKYVEYEEYAPKIVLLALAVLLIGTLLEYTRYLRIP